jgi:DNA-binding FadR family transcriptional regulator
MTAQQDVFAFPTRRPAARLGVAVVSELVELIVTGQIAEGQLLPPEGPLSEHFGVSRTIIRESVKRLEEKGLVVVAQGRGTQVARSGSWNMLDPIVLSALIDNDESLGILDELTVVRGSLEAAMAGTVAGQRTDEVFHFTVMELSRNRLAENIAKRLYRRALESSRYQGLGYEGAFESTLDEHALVVDAISKQDVEAAERAMREHIVGSWQQRRFGEPGAEAKKA